MITALYIRVSTQEQAAEGYSIGEQEDRLRLFASAHDYKGVKVYSDPGFSGSTLNRPAMQALIRDAEAGSVARVIVYKLDRLSRSQKDTLHLIEDVFLAHGVSFVSMTENFDTSTPFGMAMIGVLSVFAQLERQQIKERMTIGREARAKEGLFHGGGSIPPGYDYIDGRLVVNEYEAAQVRKAFSLAAAGMSYNQIANVMSAYSTKAGTWTHATVNNVLKNRLYLGIIRWEGNEYPGQHVPLVSPEDFAAAQKKRAPLAPKPYKRQSLLGGLLWCARCGARYHGHSKVYPRKDGTRTVTHRYICYSRSHSCASMARAERCDNRIWKYEDLDALVLGEIRKLAVDPSAVPEKKSDPSPAYRRRIADIDRQVDRLLDLYQNAEIDAERLSARVKALKVERDALSSELAEIGNVASNEQALAALASFSDAVASGSVDRVVRALVDRIVIDGDDVTIHWAFE